MNKKIIAVIATLLVTVLALTVFVACNAVDPLEAYNKIGNAKTAVQSISVKNGNMEIAKSVLNYDFAAKTLVGERKTMNDLSADEAWTTVAISETLEGGATAKLSRDTVKDLLIDLNTATCKVANENLNDVFGVNAADVNGDVSLELTSDGFNLTKLVVNYTSVHGNSVTITTQFYY